MSSSWSRRGGSGEAAWEAAWEGGRTRPGSSTEGAQAAPSPRSSGTRFHSWHLTPLAHPCVSQHPWGLWVQEGGEGQLSPSEGTARSGVPEASVSRRSCRWAEER